jgi:RHS repeat-associated protein
MKGLRGGLKGVGLAVRGLGKNARGMIADGAKGAYSRVKSMIKGCGDPVDVATGSMFLLQTDIELSGILPLVFSRRAASGYATGWWFGPTWSSTIDQHLEIDEEGIIFVTEDGLLLQYPHPADPDDPQYPETGPRWPLTRLGDDGYRVEDPVAGFSRYFARPAGGVALLTSITDRNANEIVFDHDAYGTPLAIRHTGGYHLGITTEAGRVTMLSLVGGADDGTDVVIKSYGYTDGNLTETVNSSGLPLRLTYDEHLRISSWTDTNGSSYSYTYDSLDRCVAQGGEGGHLTGTFEYDGADSAWPDHGVTTWTDSEGAVTRFVVNEKSQVVAEIDPLGNQTRTSYDDHHHLLSVTDAQGYTTRFTNNPAGQPTEITHSDGTRTCYVYDQNEKPTSVTLPDGEIWIRRYDARGNCISVTDPTGITTTYAYEDFGRPVSITNALGEVTRIACDTAGLPVRLVDPLGNCYTRRHDGFGRPIEITDPLGHTTHLHWTVEGQIARRASDGSAEEAWTYDGEGNLIQYVDAQGGVSSYEYTHFDLLRARTRPDGVRHEFEYDTSLRLTTVSTPQGSQWIYSYDAAGRLESETDFDGRRIMYEHDTTGRLVGRINALGQTVRLERNDRGQITAKHVDGSPTRYDYDRAGRLIRADSPDATLARTYDSAGRLTAESTNGRTMVYGYDGLGRRISRTTPSGAVSTWAYDAAGRRIDLTVSGRSIDLEYDAAGREISCSVSDFMSLTRDFDLQGRVTMQSAVSGTGRTIQRQIYTYRSDDTLIRLDDHLSGSRRFDVDHVGRVTAVHAQNWSECYAYDEAGNQVSANWPARHPGHGATGPREYTGTRILRAGSIRYRHDAHGRMVLRQKTRLSRKPETWRYTWDAEDRLTAVITPDGTVWRYRYDPLGRRIAKERLSPDGKSVVEWTVFSWDGSKLGEQTSGSAQRENPVTVTWEHQGLRPISQTERISAAEAPQEEIDSRFFAIITDLVGTPTELIDENGVTSWQSRSTLWGKTAWNSASTAYTPLRFPGQYFDPETELHYNYFRYYDPEIARYLSVDPLGLAPGPNALIYVENPFGWVDPIGLSPCSPGTRDDALLALDRAEELQSLRNDYFLADVKGTTSVIGVFNSETRQFVKRIGINGSGPMPSSWTLKPGEEFVQAPGHAEEGILNSLGPNEHAVYGAASRNFCNDICLPKIDVRGIEIGGEGIRGHASQNSAYTLFWTK